MLLASCFIDQLQVYPQERTKYSPRVRSRRGSFAPPPVDGLWNSKNFEPLTLTLSLTPPAPHRWDPTGFSFLEDRRRSLEGGEGDRMDSGGGKKPNIQQPRLVSAVPTGRGEARDPQNPNPESAHKTAQKSTEQKPKTSNHEQPRGPPLDPERAAPHGRRVRRGLVRPVRDDDTPVQGR